MIRNLLILCIFSFVFASGCSQPVLESTECIASRSIVKKFYSYHFGNEMKPSSENLKKREKYLSKNLNAELATQTDTAKDYFTQTDNYPKAFRVGKCETVNNEKTNFEILLFWRTNEKNIQREITVETVKENNKWVVNKVLPKN